MPTDAAAAEAWPSLPLEAWRDTYATLHRWVQIVGKVRLAQTPWVNHSWHVTLYVTPSGLTTSSIPYGTDAVQVDFDFLSHHLTVQTNEGQRASFALHSQSVATFYRRLMNAVKALGLTVTIRRR